MEDMDTVDTEKDTLEEVMEKFGAVQKAKNTLEWQRKRLQLRSVQTLAAPERHDKKQTRYIQLALEASQFLENLDQVLDSCISSAEPQIMRLELLETDWGDNDLEVAALLSRVLDSLLKIAKCMDLWLKKFNKMSPEEVDKLEEVDNLVKFLRQLGADSFLPKIPMSEGKALRVGSVAGVCAGGAAGFIAFLHGARPLAFVCAGVGVGISVLGIICLVSWLARRCIVANYKMLKADCRAARAIRDAMAKESELGLEFLKAVDITLSEIDISTDYGDTRFTSEAQECNLCLEAFASGSKALVCGNDRCAQGFLVCHACYLKLRDIGKHDKCQHCQQGMSKATWLTICTP